MDITVWYLSTCSTCLRILKDLQLDNTNARLIDIKKNPLTEDEIEKMYEAVGSYKALINGRSTQFREMDRKAKDLTENEARQLLLTHYAFLKRPVIKMDEQYFVGNSMKVVEEAKKIIND